MSIEFDESHLTSYALGELSVQENHVVEQALKESQILRNQLLEIRQSISFLQAEFGQEALPEPQPPLFLDLSLIHI